MWRQAAENVAESLTRGMRVIVAGQLKQRSYETKEGEKRTVYELQVDEVGPCLRNATAKVAKVTRTSDSNGGQRQAEPDPWARQRGHRRLLGRTSVLASPPQRPPGLPLRAGVRVPGTRETYHYITFISLPHRLA